MWLQNSGNRISAVADWQPARNSAVDDKLHGSGCQLEARNSAVDDCSDWRGQPTACNAYCAPLCELCHGSLRLWPPHFTVTLWICGCARRMARDGGEVCGMGSARLAMSFKHVHGFRRLGRGLTMCRMSRLLHGQWRDPPYPTLRTWCDLQV